MYVPGTQVRSYPGTRYRHARPARTSHLKMGNQASSDRPHGGQARDSNTEEHETGAGGPRRKRDFLKNLMEDPMKSLGLVGSALSCDSS